jgi:hypothetical protein
MEVVTMTFWDRTYSEIKDLGGFDREISFFFHSILLKLWLSTAD